MEDNSELPTIPMEEEEDGDTETHTEIEGATAEEQSSNSLFSTQIETDSDDEEQFCSFCGKSYPNEFLMKKHVAVCQKRKKIK